MAVATTGMVVEDDRAAESTSLESRMQARKNATMSHADAADDAVRTIDVFVSFTFC